MFARDRSFGARLCVALAVAAVLAAMSAPFIAGSLDPHKADGEGGYYQRLTTSFLHGQLSLEDRPPAWLVAAPNPYNPKVSAPIRSPGIHDALLYRGRYYYYWGPAPVLTVTLPARLVGAHPTERDVAYVSFLLLVVEMCALALLVAQRFSLSLLETGALAVVGATPFTAWFLLSRMSVYEGQELYAAAFTALAVLCFALATDSSGRPVRRAWLVLAGGCCAGLAVMARLETVAVLTLPAGMAIREAWRARGTSEDRSRRSGRRAALAVIVLAGLPVLVSVIVLAAYNEARFGSPAEFGLKWQLTQFDLFHAHVSSVQYILPGLYYYVLRPPDFSLHYPYFGHTGFRWHVSPLDWRYLEPAFGLLWTLPVSVAIPAAALWLRHTRHSDDEGAAGSASWSWLAAMAVLAAFGALALVSYGVLTVSQRYRVIGDVLFSAGGVILIGMAVARAGGRTRRFAAAGLSVLALASLVFALAAAGRGYYPELPTTGKSFVHRLTG